MPIQKKKKKKKEFNASLMGGYLPGAVMSKAMPITQAINMEWAGTTPPFSFHIPTPGTSFLDNYLLYFFMPSPFEQIGTLVDPMSVQEPPQRYLDNPMLIPFDLYQDVQLMKSTFQPGPYKVHGWPPEGYVENAGQSTWDSSTGTVV